MKPFQLTGTSPDGKRGSVWACGECLHTCPDEAAAVRCCDPRCQTCGEPARRGWSRCDSCRHQVEAERLQQRVDAADAVPLRDYERDHVVFDGDDQFTYVNDWGEVGDPEWAWATRSAMVPRFDALDLVASLLEDYQDGVDGVDVEALQEALDAWHDAQDFSRWWETDCSRVVYLGNGGKT